MVRLRIYKKNLNIYTYYILQTTNYITLKETK